MKILFVLENLYEHCGANVNIMLNLIGILGKKHEVHVVFFDEQRDKKVDQKKVCRPYKISMYVHTKSRKRRTAFAQMYGKPYFRLREMLYLVRNPELMPWAIDSLLGGRCYEKDCLKYIDEYCINNKIDVVIGHSFPFFCMEYISKLSCDVIKMAVQLDPYTYNYTMNARRMKKRAKREKTCVINLDAVFTTDLIIKDMVQLFSDKEKGSVRYIGIKFPNIIAGQRNEVETDTHSEFVEFVYAGSLYKKIRNPTYLFLLFSKLPANYRLHILGAELDEELEVEFADMIHILGRRLVLHGWISSSKAKECLGKADILVNLGNNIPNQVPSKCIEYIATGKPILNISYLDNCPTENILKQYDNALLLHETTSVREKDVESVIRFVEEKRNKCIPYLEILNKFEKYTDEYVANQIEQEMQHYTELRGNTK